MLGVGAALCVVALAAWRGKVWFHEARVSEAPVACPAAFPPADERTADPAPAAIRKYLRAHYDEIDYRNGATILTGRAYTGAPIVEIPNARLERALLQTRFFSTRLSNADHEKLEVEILISFRHGSDHDDIRTSYSPAFEPSHKFLGQFLGLWAPTAHDREEIALGLAELLAAITYEGVARPMPSYKGHAWAELRQSDLHWRDVQIESNRVGRVRQILVTNPADRSDVDIVSDFSVFTDL